MLVPILLAAAASSTPATVTVSGQNIQFTSGGGGATVRILWRSDGTVDQDEGGTITQIDSATDWVRPVDFADSTYEVRYTSLVGDDFTTRAANENVWIDLGSDRIWELTENGGGILGNSVTFEIRKDGGAVIDSATYMFDVDDT